MSLTEDKVQALYAEASVADYRPETVQISTTDRKTIAATCYNLPPEQVSGTNTSYAKALLALAEQLHFPEDYLRHISRFT